MSFLQQNWRRGQNRFCLEGRKVGGGRRKGRGTGVEMAQIMYAHMNNELISKFFFFSVLEFELRAFTLSHSTGLFL
jgi:hypothetical protein